MRSVAAASARRRAPNDAQQGGFEERRARGRQARALVPLVDHAVFEPTRSGDRVAIAAYLGRHDTFDRAIAVT